VLVSTAAFNLFRFDSVGNKTYLQPLFRVPGLTRRVELAGGVWAAPNGGVIPFWPLLVLLLAAALVSGLRRREGQGVPRWPAIVLVGMVAVLTAQFASWYSPFGWIAWGPRLFLPWLPVLLVLATVLYPRPAQTLASWVGGTSTRKIGAGLALALAALPHLAALRPPDPLERLFALDASCPVPAVLQKVSTGYFYRCLDHTAWAKTPVWVDSLRTLDAGRGVWLALAVVAACLAALLTAPLGVERQLAKASR